MMVRWAYNRIAMPVAIVDEGLVMMSLGSADHEKKLLIFLNSAMAEVSDDDGLDLKRVAEV